MTNYTVYFRSDAEFATYTFDAETPEQALAQAKSLFETNPAELWFQPYDGLPVNEIAVCDDDGDGGECAKWLDAEMRLRVAASDLLTALEQAVTALNTTPRFKVPSLETDSYAIASVCDRAVAKAKGGAV